MAQAGIRTPKGFKKVLSVHIGSGIDQHGKQTSVVTRYAHVLNKPHLCGSILPDYRSFACSRSGPNSRSFKSCAGCHWQKHPAWHCPLCSRRARRSEGGRLLHVCWNEHPPWTDDMAKPFHLCLAFAVASAFIQHAPPVHLCMNTMDRLQVSLVATGAHGCLKPAATHYQCMAGPDSVSSCHCNIPQCAGRTPFHLTLLLGIFTMHW